MWSSSDYSTLFYVGLLCFYVFLSRVLWASGSEIKVILSYLILISFSVHMWVTFNIFVCLNSGSAWEFYLLAVNILTARFCIRFSRFARCPHARIP